MARQICDAIAYPDAWVDSNGVKHSAARPIVAAARTLCATQGGATIAVRGVHQDFSVGDVASKSATISVPGMPVLPRIALYGDDASAEIGSVPFWANPGGSRPGPFGVYDLRVRASNLSKFCMLLAQHTNFPELELEIDNVEFAQWSSTSLIAASAAARTFTRLITGDGPTKGGALWGVRAQGRPRSIRMSRVQSDGFAEWGLLYADDFEVSLEVLASICSDAGRGAVQLASRQWEDKGQTVPTTLAATPITAVARVRDNLLIDCSSYPDPKAKGGQMANGSAITSAGLPCGLLEIVKNRIVQSHPGGGGIAVWDDKPKIGNHRTAPTAAAPNGYAHSRVICTDNQLHILAGAGAGREAAQLGGCDTLELARNALTGSEKRVALNHTAPIGTLIGSFEG